MSPESSTSTSMKQTMFPTSPWTEVYQFAGHEMMSQGTSSSQTEQDDTQQPTHDALSDAYNF